MKSFLFALLLFPVVAFRQAEAWDLPHYRIVEVAAQVQPERARWEQILGAEYHRIAGDDAKNGYVFLPDEHGLYATGQNRLAGEGLPGAGAGSKWIDCFPYDYLMLRDIPPPDFYIHHGPQGGDLKFIHEVGAFAQRSLQALRTETPREACLWLGSLLHWVSDSSALAHAAEIGVVDGHTYLDRCLNDKAQLARIALPDYQPVLLGETDSEVISGVQKRTRELLAYTKERGDKVKPLFQAAKESAAKSNADPLPAGIFHFSKMPREEIAFLAVEAAQEGARACADVLHTLLTTGLAEAARGGSLAGRVGSPAIPTYQESAVLVALLDATKLKDSEPTHDAIYSAATPYATHAGLDGRYQFHHLPPGNYRALTYKVGSVLMLSEPFKLTAGGSLQRDFTLVATTPPGNLVWNPELKLGLLHKGAPDRWLKMEPVQGRHCHVSAPVTLNPDTAFRFGLESEDPATQATVIVFGPAVKGSVWKAVIRAGAINERLGVRHDAAPEGRRIAAMAGVRYAIIQIVSDKPLAEAVKNVWLLPEHHSVETLQK